MNLVDEVVLHIAGGFAFAVIKHVRHIAEIIDHVGVEADLGFGDFGTLAIGCGVGDSDAFVTLILTAVRAGDALLRAHIEADSEGADDIDLTAVIFVDRVGEKGAAGRAGCFFGFGVARAEVDGIDFGDEAGFAIAAEDAREDFGHHGAEISCDFDIGGHAVAVGGFEFDAFLEEIGNGFDFFHDGVCVYVNISFKIFYESHDICKVVGIEELGEFFIKNGIDGGWEGDGIGEEAADGHAIGGHEAFTSRDIL